MQKNFKVLTYANQYIDANRLNQGLYSCAVPYLYDKDTTIEKLIAQAETVKEKLGPSYINDKYFESLKSCTLLRVTLAQDE